MSFVYYLFPLTAFLPPLPSLMKLVWKIRELKSTPIVRYSNHLRVLLVYALLISKKAVAVPVVCHIFELTFRLRSVELGFGLLEQSCGGMIWPAFWTLIIFADYIWDSRCNSLCSFALRVFKKQLSHWNSLACEFWELSFLVKDKSSLVSSSCWKGHTLVMQVSTQNDSFLPAARIACLKTSCLNLNYLLHNLSDNLFFTWQQKKNKIKSKNPHWSLADYLRHLWSF